MRPLFSIHFIRAYRNAPASIRNTFDKQLQFLLQDIRHPSLRAKKYDTKRWQARVNRDWRFYFRIAGDMYVLLDIVPHPK